MSDGAEYLKYMTQRVVSYWETPKSPGLRRERRQRRESWMTRWFGQLLPIGLGIWVRNRRARADERAEIQAQSVKTPDA